MKNAQGLGQGYPTPAAYVWCLRRIALKTCVTNQQFVTAYLREGKWQRGEDVRTVVVHGERYLRTDGNSVKADNLGSLPEY